MVQDLFFHFVVLWQHNKEGEEALQKVQRCWNAEGEGIHLLQEVWGSPLLFQHKELLPAVARRTITRQSPSPTAASSVHQRLGSYVPFEVNVQLISVVVFWMGKHKRVRLTPPLNGVKSLNSTFLKEYLQARYTIDPQVILKTLNLHLYN